jgi:hypothetical protein
VGYGIYGMGSHATRLCVGSLAEVESVSIKPAWLSMFFLHAWLSMLRDEIIRK